MLEPCKYSCNILMQDLNLTRRTTSTTLTTVRYRESATYDFDQSNYRITDAIMNAVLLRCTFLKSLKIHLKLGHYIMFKE